MCKYYKKRAGGLPSALLRCNIMLLFFYLNLGVSVLFPALVNAA